MEMPQEQKEPPSSPGALSTSNELVKLIRKLQWIGMKDEAERLLRELVRRRAAATDSVLAMSADTD